MLLEEINSILENHFSPKIYTVDGEEYGIQYGQSNMNKEIKKILVTSDLTVESIHYGLKNKVNLIISRNGLIQEPIKSIDGTLIKKLGLLSKYPISIFVLNSSFIAAEGGVSDTIMDLLHCEVDEILNIQNRIGLKVPIGRICHPINYSDKNFELSLEDILRRIQKNLKVEGITYFGQLDSRIKKICIIGGEISEIISLQNIIKKGCNCIISGTVNKKLINFARDFKVNIIQFSLHSSENLALRKLSNYLSLEFPYDQFFFYEIKDSVNFYK